LADQFVEELVARLVEELAARLVGRQLPEQVVEARELKEK
jgi:hypothetical protein